MIPDLIDIKTSPWKLLPAGIHPASLREVEEVFAINNHRRLLFSGLVLAVKSLADAGCNTIYLDGSYVTGKPKPGDYDACWDPLNVDNKILDQVFLDFSNKRLNQKLKFQGEFFPFGIDAGTGKTFLEFFQTDRFSGEQKGILIIDLSLENFDQVREG